VAFYSLNAMAQFGPVNNLLSNPNLGYPVAIDKGDFNQDGFEDVIIAFSNYVYWWPNTGNNGFSEPIQLSTPPYDTAFGGWTIGNMISADLDQDGNKDVACVVNYAVPNTTGIQSSFNSLGPGPPPPPPSKEQGRIFIYKGLGNGLFSEGKFIAKNFGHLSAIRAGNMDSSQTLEIVASSLQSPTSLFGDTIIPFGYNDLPGKVAVYSNITFDDTLLATEMILSDSAIQGINVELGDIENDGDLDVFFSSSFTGFAGWMENLGNGSFGPKQWITEANGQQLAYFKLADLNGDSLIDFVYNSIGGGCKWQRNMGDEQFGNSISLGASNVSYGNFTISDVDADNDMDIIVLQGGVSYLENSGDGSSFSTIILDRFSSYCSYTCVSDINNDNTVEILGAGSPNYGTLALYQRNSNSDWNNRYVVYPKLTNVQNVMPGDIDGDGDIDLVAGSMYDGKIVYFSNAGAGNFSEPINISYSTLNLKDISVADVDNDLDLDIIAVSLVDSNIQLFRNNGLGNFQHPEIIANHLYSGARIVTADFDQDGNIDIAGTFSLGTYNFYRKVYAIRNSGNGVYEQPVLIADSVVWGSDLLLTADLDQDNFPDLVSASSTTLIWMKSLGNGLFDSSAVIYNQLATIRDIKVADVNQDLRNDILVAANGTTNNTNYFVQLENLGGGIFSSPILFQTTYPNWRGNAIETMDFDLDNDEDIVVMAYETSQNYNHVSALMLNDGDSNYALPEIFPPNFYSNTMVLCHADLNDDSYPDLIRFYKNITTLVPIYWQANTGGISTSIEKPVGEFSVYPNPNKGRFYIQQLNEIDKGSVNVFSLDGRMVNCNISYSSNQTEISVNAEAGIYILSWISNNKKEFRKVIIQE
jgi:hypothetical protein